jgi:heat shock protein HslJ
MENTHIFEDGFETSFVAYGHEPEWNVKITDENIIYRNINFPDTMKFSHSKPQNMEDKVGLVYSGKNEKGETIRVEIVKEKCQDTMADKEFDCQVKVFFSSNQMIGEPGCGEFVEDPRLQKKWILETMNGHPIAELKNGKIPYIQFDPKRNQMGADMGCNGISGGYTLLGNHIFFSSGLARTLMYCEGVMDLEEQFAKMVTGKTVVYSFKGNRLFFHTKENIQLASFKTN